MTSAACSGSPDDSGVLTFSGSVLGTEGDIVRAQLARFERQNPGMRVELRVTPDAAAARLRLAGCEESIVRVTANQDAAVRADDVLGLRFRHDRLHLFRASDGERVAK